MQETKILTAIDVGTTKVCTIIARRTEDGDVKALAHSVVPCDGLSKGNVVDITATSNAIRLSVEEAERKAGVKTNSAHVGVTGVHVSFENRSDTLQWVGYKGVITPDDLVRVPDKIASASKETGRKVLHVLPMNYSLDGKSGVRNPIGMHTRQLEVETHVISGLDTFIARLLDAASIAGVTVDDLVLEPLASSEAVLTQEEKEKGVALIDIGGGTTDVVVFQSGNIFYTSVLPVGGFQFTNDISQMYDAPYEAAEKAKLEFASTEPEDVRPEENVPLAAFDRTGKRNVSRHDLCQLTRERAQELIRLIKVKLKETDIEDISNFPVVVTGGASNLPGLQELMRKTLSENVRSGVPNGSLAISDALREPAYATAVGILIWAANKQLPPPPQSVNGNGNGHESYHGDESGKVSRFVKRFKSMLAIE